MSNDVKNVNLKSNINSKRIRPSFDEIEKKIFKLFHKKYFVSNNVYGKIIINNIIYNEKTHIVAKFKDYLVIDDLSEFLKRYYKKEESLKRLPLYFEYYFLYSKIFPNYTTLKESKYIYKNIHRKQKMIDLQQEEESKEQKKEIKHQRKKNKLDKDTIFNNDIYNSIIKQSQDLYMILFGIDKNKITDTQNSFSSVDIKDIVKLIEKYDYESKIGFNYKNNLIMPKINKINNQKRYVKKENNSSLTTKQSTFNSSIMHQKIKNFGKLYKNNNDIIIGLKKLKNEKKSNTSNSLLMSQKLSKNNLGNSYLKTLKSINFIKSNENSKSKSKSKKKDIKKVNQIKVNQILLVDDKKNYFTERTSIHNKYRNLKFDFHPNYNNNNNNKAQKNPNIKNINNNNINNKLRNRLINKNSIDFNYYSQLNSQNNSKINKHKRINTNMNESSRYKSYKIKLLNRHKTNNNNSDNNNNNNNNNNKLKLNIKEIREFIKNNKIIEKKCFTERETLMSSKKEKKKDKSQNNRIKDNIKIFKKINNHKKSVPSIDLKKKINKNLLLSQRIISSSKVNKYNFKTNFLPLPFRENFKINKNQIMNICNRKLSSNIDKIEDKYYSERGSIQYQKKENTQEKMKLVVPNDLSIFKKIETKYYNTTTNSKNKNKDKNKNIINSKEKNMNNNTFHKKNISKVYKQIKRREISLIEYNKYIMLNNNTERNKKLINNKILLNNQNKK